MSSFIVKQEMGIIQACFYGETNLQVFRDYYSYLAQMDLPDKIKILQIYKVVPNANNLDVLEIQGLFMVLNKFDSSKPLLLKAISCPMLFKDTTTSRVPSLTRSGEPVQFAC